MHALGKPVFGYTSAPLPYLERVRALAGSLEAREGRWWDAEEFSVEDFGLSENLMLAVSIAEASGGIRAVAEEGRDALAALRAFEACMEEIAARLRNRTQGAGR
jgi:nucleoside 2-deoxyribosyltransferase